MDKLPEEEPCDLGETETDTRESPVPDAKPSADKAAKKRTWRKPKDKPKRPLSAYNIFFQHERSRIVEGHTEEATPEEIVRSIESILSKSREKRRHRKTHGRISFGDLARAIADQWKNINPKSKAIFDHYAEVDMLRYRREVKVWREKKELEMEADAMARHNSFISSMSNSMSSSASEDVGYDAVPPDSSRSDSRALHESFNSSYSSSVCDSPAASQYSVEQGSISHVLRRQQQILQQQLRDGKSSFGGSAMSSPRMQPPYVSPLSQSYNQSMGSSLSGSMADYGQQTIQQMQFQQMQQLQQMQRIQMQQQQIQHQMKMQQQQLQQSMVMSMNMTSPDVPSRSFTAPNMPMTLPFGNNPQPAMGNMSFDQSIHLGDALLGPSNHVSDYSSSEHNPNDASLFSGFASTTSFGYSQSDALTSASVHEDLQNQFKGPFGMQQQRRPGGGNIGNHDFDMEGSNNNNNSMMR